MVLLLCFIISYYINYIIFIYDFCIFFGIINLCKFCISLVVFILNIDNLFVLMLMVKILKDIVI